MHQHLSVIVIVLFITVSGSAQSWVEIAFGTRSGVVRVIVQHPENVGQGLQVFRTFVAHTSPVIKVVLGEKHLITGKHSKYLQCSCSQYLQWNLYSPTLIGTLNLYKDIEKSYWHSKQCRVLHYRELLRFHCRSRNKYIYMYICMYL